MTQYDYAILGAGALGSILGAHLARAGHSVVMLVRENRAKQIDSQGLRITGLSEFTQSVPTLVDTVALRSAKVLIVAMKTQGTTEALAPLRSSRIDAVFSVQNGLAKDELLVDAFGTQRVLGSLANTSGELMASGEVLFTRNVGLMLGPLLAPEVAESDESTAHRIARELESAGIRSSAVPDIVSREWSKFAAWAGFMILSITVRSATWKYLLDPDSALLHARLVRELGTLAKASGIPLTDDSLLPVASMCSGSEEQAVEAVMRAGQDFKTRVPDHRMSSLQDLDAGRALEVEYTLGHAARKAASLGLDLPLLEASYRLAASIDRNR
jgi:2-dehydropantoate 2-reductase